MLETPPDVVGKAKAEKFPYFLADAVGHRYSIRSLFSGERGATVLGVLGRKIRQLDPAPRITGSIFHHWGERSTT